MAVDLVIDLWSFIAMAVITGIVGILILIPWIYETYHLNSMKKDMLKQYNGFKEIPENDRLDFIKELLSPTPPRRGTSRFSMMLGVTLLIGLATVFLMFYKSENLEDLQTPLGVLTGALATIVGFYFGGRAEAVKSEELEKAMEKLKEKPGKKLKQN